MSTLLGDFPQLEATLQRSLTERTSDNQNLENAFRRCNDLVHGLDDALGRLRTDDLNSLVQVYQRARQIPGLWDHVHTIRDIWTGSSRGFYFL